MTRECREIRDLLDSYARGELLVETNHTVIRHLSTCSACAGELDRRQRALSLLRESLAVDVDVDDVRRRVVDALDREQRWWSGTARRWGLAAAALLIVAAVWFSLRGTAVDAAAYRDSAAQHALCALSFPANWVYHPQRMAKHLDPRFAPLAERLVEPGADYRLIEAHNCSYEQRRYAHLIFRDPQGGTMSLFVERQQRGVLPRPEPQTREPRVAAAVAAGHHLFVIAGDRTAAPDAIVRQLLDAASQFMTTLER